MTNRLPVAAVLLSGLSILANAQPPRIPPLHAAVLTGQTVNLPDDLKGKSAVLVLGFSQASRDQVTEWGKRLAADYRGSAAVAYYEMPILESVPRLLRGWVTKKMAESVPDRAKDHFMPVSDHEREWKSAVFYSKSDDAYVLVVDSGGGIRSRLEGGASDVNYAEVKRQLQALQ